MHAVLAEESKVDFRLRRREGVGCYCYAEGYKWTCCEGWVGLAGKRDGPIVIGTFVFCKGLDLGCVCETCKLDCIYNLDCARYCIIWTLIYLN